MALSWSGATGYTDRNSNSEAIRPQHPVRVASNTKTFVAAAILRLWEEQHLDLDVSIRQFLSSEHCTIISTHGYSLEAITIRHLLTHTSGLFDYADKQFETTFTENPHHRWTRTEQLQGAMKWGKPYGEPGEVYRYSDTGYILLGEIIERVYGQSLGIALRQLLDYSRLGLNATWLEILEPAPAGLLSRVHQYVGDVDTYHHDASYDIYGGGGLVSTVGDLARFMQALFVGNVYAQPTTLEAMLTTVHATRGGPACRGTEQTPGTYRLGIQGGKTGTVYSHSGYLGTVGAYIPALDVAFSFSINISQHDGANDERKKLLTAILALFEVTA